jgi:outer membrane receptor protein involved in Fe transport
MKKPFTLLALLIVTANLIIAQTVRISGTVLDADNKEALGGVNIRYDKTKGVVTDESGKYVINVPVGEHELVMSTDGYKNFKLLLTFAKDTTIDAMMRPSALQLNQVETVSQYRKNAAKETISVQVISAEQIQNTNSTDLGDVVSRAPGVLVQDGQISIRGGSPYSYGVGSRTAVMQDGLPLMSADLGQGQVQMANLSDVKQVEIIEGASSCVYGSSAIDGVVNLITSWPTDPEPQNEISVSNTAYDKPKLAYQQWSDVPPFGSNVNFKHSEQIRHIQLVIAASMFYNSGYNSENSDFRFQGFWKLRYLHPKIDGLNFGVNGSMQFERDQTLFISKDLDSNAYVYGDGSNDKYLRTNIDPFLSYQNPKGHRLTFNSRYMDIFRDGGSKPANAVSNQYIVFDQYQYRYKNLLVISVGAPFNVASSRSNLYSGQDFSFNAAVYTQAEFDYKFLTLQGGVRYEAAGVDTSIVRNQPPIFRLGANIQAGKATFFRASWGQGFRIPSIGEKYIAQQFTGSLFIVPNDTLKTENSWNLEIGIKQGFKIKNFVGDFDFCVFWEQEKNFIQYQIGFYPNHYSNGAQIFPDSDQYSGTNEILGLKAFNVQSTRVAGYEVKLEGFGNMGPVGVRMLMGYTYTYPGEQTPGQTYPLDQFLKDVFKYNFQRVPQAYATNLETGAIRHLVRADVEFSIWKVYFGGTLAYASTPESIPPLFEAASIELFHSATALSTYYNEHLHGDVILDVRAGMKLTDHMKLGFIIKNVGNVLYELRPGLAEPNRNYTFQFTYSFGRTKTVKQKAD